MRTPITGARVSLAALSPLAAALDDAGIDARALFAAHGVSGDALADPEARLPREIAGDLWRAAVDATGDPALGFRAAARLRPHAVDVLHYVVRNRRTVGEALDALARYAPLAADGIEIELTVGPDLARLSYRVAGKSYPEVATQFILSAIASFLRRLADPPVRLIAVTIAHPTPADAAPYTAAFAAPVRFGADANALMFSRRHLASRLRGADPRLSSVVMRLADQQLSATGDADLAARVRRLVAEDLAGHGTSAASIARQLHMSQRTLHRRLRDAGTSYVRLVDDVRASLASRYLDQGELTRKEIADRLGFRDPSALRKALHRWGRAS